MEVPLPFLLIGDPEICAEHRNGNISPLDLYAKFFHAGAYRVPTWEVHCSRGQKARVIKKNSLRNFCRGVEFLDQVGPVNRTVIPPSRPKTGLLEPQHVMGLFLFEPRG